MKCFRLSYFNDLPPFDYASGRILIRVCFLIIPEAIILPDSQSKLLATRFRMIALNTNVSSCFFCVGAGGILTRGFYDSPYPS